MIEIKQLHAYYGPIEALHGLDLTVADGAITALVGSNGAGKTTLLKSISGMVRRTGSILFNGRDELIGRKAGYMARHYIIHVPEGRHIFPGLTVEQNLETGTVNWHGFFGRKPFEREMQEVFELFPVLRERRKQLGWSLSGGEQQMLAIGRALMASRRHDRRRNHAHRRTVRLAGRQALAGRRRARHGLRRETRRPCYRAA